MVDFKKLLRKELLKKVCPGCGACGLDNDKKDRKPLIERTEEGYRCRVCGWEW